MENRLPDPRLTRVFRLEATLGEPLISATPLGAAGIVPASGGIRRFRAQRKAAAGRERRLAGRLPDGTTLGDIRHTLQTDDGALLYVQSRGVRHGSAEVIARLGRGEDVAPSEYTFRTWTQIETASPRLDWLNKGVFISVGGRRPESVIYETYLVA